MRWRGCGGNIGLCALCVGAGILLGTLFPPGFVMFLVAMLLIVCGIFFLSDGR
jgi:hypothetical protein